MKIRSKNECLVNSKSILEWNPNRSVNEITQLSKTETPEFKEGLVVYFLQIDDSAFKRAKEKLNSADTNFKIKPPLPVPTDSGKYDGDEGKSFGLVGLGVKHLNEDPLLPREKEFYFNAVSIADRVRTNYGGAVQADRGKTFSAIRKHAKKLIELEYEITTEYDKWCPADIYIYNTADAGQKALESKSVNQGKNSLNSFFQTTDKKGKKGILGISLKEAKAQAGKAGSFKNVLIKEKNYPDAPGLSPTLETIMRLFYNLRMVKESGGLDLESKIDSIKYLVNSYNAVTKLITLGQNRGNMPKLQKSLQNILTTEVGASILKSSASATGYDSKKVKAGLESKFQTKYPDTDLKTISMKSNVLDRKYKDAKNEDIVKLTSSIAKTINEQLLTEYNKRRSSFVKVLKNDGFSTPVVSGKPLATSKIGLDIENAETLLKKARCYGIAEWFISGLNTETLKIPPVYKTIMNQKNAFVALTAFAIGMAGVSPTFFKYKGNKKGGEPTVEPFWGNGFLNLEGEKSKIEIQDNPANKGFRVTFETNVTLEDAPGSDIVGKYKVTLDFRYAGDQINIEVQDLAGQH